MIHKFIAAHNCVYRHSRLSAAGRTAPDRHHCNWNRPKAKRPTLRAENGQYGRPIVTIEIHPIHNVSRVKSDMARVYLNCIPLLCLNFV